MQQETLFPLPEPDPRPAATRHQLVETVRRLADLRHDLPPPEDWRTTDADEIRRRKIRAETEPFTIRNLHPLHPVHTTFAVATRRPRAYHVEIRRLQPSPPLHSCTCPDFRGNGLNTCKHIEAVHLHLRQQLSPALLAVPSDRADILPAPDHDTLRLENPALAHPRLPSAAALWFNPGTGLPSADAPPLRDLLAQLETLAATHPALRLSQEITPWLQQRDHAAASAALRSELQRRVDSGEIADTDLPPLLPHQRQGMMHLALAQKAILADDLALDPPLQAIAAVLLLHRLGQLRRILLVAPASQHPHWLHLIRRHTPFSCHSLPSGPQPPLPATTPAPDVTLLTYDQLPSVAELLHARLRPDALILADAHLLASWRSPISRALKTFTAPHILALTSAPIDLRPDELYALADLLAPGLLGPLFRFNRDFYNLDVQGHPAGLKNQPLLHQRLAPILLRRRSHLLPGLPPAPVHLHRLLPLSHHQRDRHQTALDDATLLHTLSLRRPLARDEERDLLRSLQRMRMTCVANYLLDRLDRSSPKLDELEQLLLHSLPTAPPDDLSASGKIIILSEWESSLRLVADLCHTLALPCALLARDQPPALRAQELQRLRSDPRTRILLCTDDTQPSHEESAVLPPLAHLVSLDLPWSIHRRQRRLRHLAPGALVIQLLAADSIEERLHHLPATHQSLAANLLDLQGDLERPQLTSSPRVLLDTLRHLLPPAPAEDFPLLAPAAEPIIEDSATENLILQRLPLATALVRPRILLLVHPPEKDPAPLHALHTRLLRQAETGTDTFPRHVPPLLRLLPLPAYQSLRQLAADGLATLPEQSSDCLLIEL